MSALAAPRKNFSNKGPVLLDFAHPAKTGKVFFAGAMAMKGADGYLVPAAATAGGRVMGIVELENHPSSDTTGKADGAELINCRLGIWPLAMGATVDAVTKADEGNDVYVLDDQTISRLPGAGRPVAGQLWLVEGTTAWVGIGYYTPKNDASDSDGTEFQGAGSSEAFASPGALSVATEISLMTTDGTDAVSLADGLFAGQRKIVTVVAGTNTPLATITPATPSGFATVTALGGVGDTVTFLWTGAAWVIAGAFGVTFT